MLDLEGRTYYAQNAQGSQVALVPKVALFYPPIFVG